jgi:hypothetical protein
VSVLLVVLPTELEPKYSLLLKRSEPVRKECQILDGIEHGLAIGVAIGNVQPADAF